jgi:hypothetical protein
MPTVGQAPAVIPIPELSEEEKQERIADLEKAFQLHRGIREKVAKVMPQLDEIFRDFAKLHEHISHTQTLRLARLSRLLMTDPLVKLVFGARNHLQRLTRLSAHAERNSGDVEKDILDPSLYPSDRTQRRKPDKAKK